MDQEAQIIQAVFPMKEDVMRVFLQRVFAQVVSLRAIFDGRADRKAKRIDFGDRSSNI